MFIIIFGCCIYCFIFYVVVVVDVVEMFFVGEVICVFVDMVIKGIYWKDVI